MHSVILVSFILMMAITTASYALWFEALNTNTYVSTGDWNSRIGSYKGLKCCIHTCCQCCCCHCKGLDDGQMYLSDGNESLNIVNVSSSHCRHGNTTLWIGMIIEHYGDIPSRLNGVNVTVNGTSSGYSIEEFIYGPYKTGIGYREWGHIDGCDLPFSNHTSSIVLEKGWKAIIWVKITFHQNIINVNITLSIDEDSWNKI